jgi:FtsH-binding integral membrane protein
MSEILDHQGSYAKASTLEFFRNVYSYMFAALGISGLVAYLFGAGEYSGFLYEIDSATMTLAPSVLFYVVAFAPLIIGIVIQSAFHRLSLGVLLFLFVLYSFTMGLSLSSIFLVYKMGAIAMTFFVTAGAFGGMAILGYTTKTDLTRFGSLLYMVLIGIVIASIVNLFLQSSGFDFLISVLGVFVFTGLTAYSMQQLKALSQDTSIGVNDRNKLALIGGLQLYILFVNLFLSLLRIMGSRD